MNIGKVAENFYEYAVNSPNQILELGIRGI